MDLSDKMRSSFSGTPGMSSIITRIMGFSMFASFFGAQSDSLASNSVKLFILGTLVEVGRRFFQWFYERFNVFQFSVTAQFDEGDPIYEWVTLFLTEKKIWKRSRHFHVSTPTSKRRWGIRLARPANDNGDQADYVPTYEVPQLFKWNGYWAEIRRSSTNVDVFSDMGDHLGTSKSLYLTIYTRDMSKLSAFVEDARSLYVSTSRPRVTVHTADQNTYSPATPWINIKSKSRRPLDTVVLQHGVLETLLEDAREFLSIEDWYIKAGIPYRRGYLLHGPPGTGKTSTIYSLAGELGLEIYSLSLAASFVDDSFLQRAVSCIPKSAIFVIEDIDCAFSSREDDDDEPEEFHFIPGRRMNIGRRRGDRKISNVTLSGLLNVLDGIGSEEGKLFFATTNYLDRLDPALIRPGRIDKIEYYLSTKEQAKSLFERFYSVSALSGARSELGPATSLLEKHPDFPSDQKQDFESLSSQFSSALPEEEFSTAELQGYLLSHKKEPKRAVVEFHAWIEDQRKDREEKRIREEERKEKKLARERQLMNINKDSASAPAQVPLALTPSADSASALVPTVDDKTEASVVSICTNCGDGQGSISQAPLPPVQL